ncbi:MAG TPA: hypothetical protein VLF62_02980, partial [Candidatus Saccharimonadales bacterium]|nr:hypothetical protein [Candidatus Saccharimonadales bacterium]
MFVAPEIIPLEAVSKSAAAVQAAAGASLEGVAYLDTADVLRWRGAEDVRTVQSIRANLPQLPDTEVDEIYERIVAAEAQIVGAGRTLATYDEGTAQVDDELLVATFPGAVLLEAQHATDPVRKSDGLRGGADHGTGGLGLVLAQDVGGRIIIPRGRQMGNANVSPEHPVKDALLQSAAGGAYERFFSVHGCAPSKVTGPLDEVEVHAIIGLGLNPGE